MKRFIWIVCFIALIVGGVRLYFRLTDDFRLANITYKMPHYPEWDMEQPKNWQEIQNLFSQEYHYIGKGAQAYAFVGDDGRTVLKFFKFKHLRPNGFAEMLPVISPFKEYKENLAIRKHRKLYGVFEGYRLAYSVHRKESGLLFVQLNTPQNHQLVAHLKDKLGFKRQVELNKVPFVLQEKARITRGVINSALKESKVDEALLRIAQILDLYQSEYRKGIYDKDHGVMHNTGFVDERPIHLDIGKLTREKELEQKQFWQRDLEIIAWKFVTWTRENYPEHSLQLEVGLETELSKRFERPFAFADSIPPLRKKKH